MWFMIIRFVREQMRNKDRSEWSETQTVKSEIITSLVLASVFMTNKETPRLPHRDGRRWQDQGGVGWSVRSAGTNRGCSIESTNIFRLVTWVTHDFVQCVCGGVMVLWCIDALVLMAFYWSWCMMMMVVLMIFCDKHFPPFRCENFDKVRKS